MLSSCEYADEFLYSITFSNSVYFTDNERVHTKSQCRFFETKSQILMLYIAVRKIS